MKSALISRALRSGPNPGIQLLFQNSEIPFSSGVRVYWERNGLAGVLA